MGYVNHGSRRGFIEQMEGLVRLCSSKNISLKPGTCAKTDAKGTIWLPWLPENATEEDYLKFYCKAMHEQAHFEGESDLSKIASPDPKYAKLYGMLVNIADDIRCENVQEKTYPGFRVHRKPYFETWNKEKGYEKFLTATKKDMGAFFHALGCLAICRVRHPHVGLDTDYELNPELEEAYNKYFRDLEPQLDAQESFEETLKLAGTMLERLKDLIKDDILNEPNKVGQGKPQQCNNPQENEEDSDGEPQENEENSDGEPQDGDDDRSNGNTKRNDGSDDEDGDEKEERQADGQEEEEGQGEEDSLTNEQEEELEKALQDLENSKDLKGTIDDDITEDINHIANESDEYMVDPDVKDVIKYNDDISLTYTSDYLQQLGFRLLGSAGSRLTRLFVSNIKPRTIRNQEHGRVDLQAVITDTWDTRKDVRTIRRPGKLSKAAVSFVLDNSGSMKGTRSEYCYAIMSAMLHYLSKANVPTEVVGFTMDSGSYSSLWRDAPIHLRIVKTFADRYGREVMNRCIPPKFMNYTLEVDALRWAAPRLLARPEGKKVMFVLGDGNTEFGNSVLERKAIKAYREYVKKCREVGIIVCGFGLNIDLSNIFGDDFICITTSNMGPIMLQKLKKILNRR